MGSLKGAVSLIERKLRMIGDESDNDSKINRGSFVFFLKSSWKKIIAKKPNMKITRAQFRELTRDIAVEWRKLPRSSRDSYDALYENGFLIKNNLERQLNSNEINKYARGRRTTHSCLRVSESLYNILELVAKDQITNEKAIVVANKDRKKKRKQAKTAVAPSLKNDPEEQSQITSEFSSAMISGDAHVVQKKDDQSQATDAITDSAMRDVERSPSAAAKSSTHSIQSIKSTTSSRQSDKHMSLHLNSHGSIAPEPMVEEVTVERVQSVTESMPQSESSQKTDMDVENLEGEEMTIDDEETRINSSDDRPAVALAASVSQLVLADAFKANEAVNEMDAIDESEEIDPSEANSVAKVNTIYSSEENQAARRNSSNKLTILLPMLMWLTIVALFPTGPMKVSSQKQLPVRLQLPKNRSKIQSSKTRKKNRWQRTSLLKSRLPPPPLLSRSPKSQQLKVRTKTRMPFPWLNPS